MSGLLQEIKQEKRARLKNRIDTIIEQLGDVDGQEFLDALNDHSIPATSIVRVMTKRGYKLSDTQVSNFRHKVVNSAT